MSDPQYDPARITHAAIRLLDAAAERNSEAAGWAAYDWLQTNSAGLPYLGLIEDYARSDARFWAETASPIELECYFLAASDRLCMGNGFFTSRQIKRLAGSLFRRMSPNEQKAFKKWINEQVRDD